MMRLRLFRVALAVVVALAARSAAAADPALIEAAKKEGQVFWYTTLVINQIVRPLKDAFEKKYPGVTLQYARADDLVTAATRSNTRIRTRASTASGSRTCARTAPRRGWKNSSRRPRI